MATTFVDYTGDGNATKAFSFPSYKVEDIKVDVDGVIKTVSTHYNITSYTTTGGGNVVFTSGNIPVSPAAIRIFRDTDVDSPKATYTAGSSVKADDLNNNHTQLLYAAQEEQNQTILTSDIKDAAVTTAKIKADNITSALIADDQINSEHYVDGSIDTAHIADAQITTAKIADNAVTSAKIADLNIVTGDLADDSVTTAKIVDLNIVTGLIADDAVTTAKIADNNIVTGLIADDAVTHAKLADNAVQTGNIMNGHVDAIKLNQTSGGEAVVTNAIRDLNVTTAKIATNAVTTDKIADAELSTLASMQSGTASILADSTALTATTTELNQLDGITLETSVTTNSDTRIPTSKAVNDLVLSVVNAVGGFVAIANETSFPTANPDPSNNAGTVVSISQLASGLAVNGSGVATISNGAGTGNTVTITGFPTSLQSQTLPANSGLQVQTTSTLHTYTFHKQLASAADIQAISATVNSFSNRYRVSASAPTSSLDGGDLWYDTTNSKLMVYSSQNSAWEESSAIGNFFISTISSSSSTGGGSATANGTAYRFTLSDAPTSAQQLIVSVDGVIQKPNAGSSQPSEGFVLVGNDIIFGAAPANGASIFVTVIGSTVGIGTPSDNTVTTAILQNASVTTAKIADANVTTAKIADANVTTAKIADNAIIQSKIANNAVTTAEINNLAVTTAKLNDAAVTTVKIADNAVATAKIADQAVTLAKLPHGDGSSDGKFLRANNGADPTFESIPPAAITAIANTGANRVITDDGDGTVTAESSLNFTGDRLLVNTSTPDPYGNRSLTVAAGTSGGNTTTAIEVRSPTNGDGRIIFTDSTSSSDTGSYKGQIMYDQNNDFMQFSVNGAQEAMRINSSKKVGINTTSPVGKLTIDENNASEHFQLRNTTNTSNFAALGVDSSFNLRCYVNQSERMRIESNGNVLIGTTSFNNGNFTGSGHGMCIGGTAPQLTLHRTDNDKDVFFGNNGTNAYLFSADDMPIVFGTGDAERMRISATGKVGMGVAPATGSTLRVNQPTATDYDAATAANNPAIIIGASSGGGADGKCVGLSFNGPNANGEANFAMVGDGTNECNFHLGMRSGGTRKDVLKIEPTARFQIGVSNSPSHAGVSIAAGDYPSFRLWDDQMSDNFVIRYENNTQRVQFINNHNGAYLSRGGTGLSSYSDERLKTIVSNITGGFEKIKGLRTVIGHYNDDPDKYQKPFLIAQDVQAVLPEAVSTREPDKLTLCYTEVIPLLTNALQEAIAKIEVLETKVAALEAA